MEARHLFDSHLFAANRNHTQRETGRLSKERTLISSSLCHLASTTILWAVAGSTTVMLESISKDHNTASPHLVCLCSVATRKPRKSQEVLRGVWVVTHLQGHSSTLSVWRDHTSQACSKEEKSDVPNVLPGSWMLLTLLPWFPRTSTTNLEIGSHYDHWALQRTVLRKAEEAASWSGHHVAEPSLYPISAKLIHAAKLHRSTLLENL